MSNPETTPSGHPPFDPEAFQRQLDAMGMNASPDSFEDVPKTCTPEFAALVDKLRLEYESLKARFGAEAAFKASIRGAHLWDETERKFAPAG